jgi:hypothetical protein
MFCKEGKKIDTDITPKYILENTEAWPSCGDRELWIKWQHYKLRYLVLLDLPNKTSMIDQVNVIRRFTTNFKGYINWIQKLESHLMNCFLSEWVPIPHSNVDTCSQTLCFQSHFDSISLQQFSQKSKCICLQEEAVVHIKLIKGKKAERKNWNMVFSRKNSKATSKDHPKKKPGILILKRACILPAHPLFYAKASPLQ